MTGKTDCLNCSHCTYVHEYESYICEKKRMPFYNIHTDPVECTDFEEYFEED